MRPAYAPETDRLGRTGDDHAGRRDRRSAALDPVRSPDADPLLTPAERGALRLQRLAGNRAVAAVLSDPDHALGLLRDGRTTRLTDGVVATPSVAVQTDALLATEGLTAPIAPIAAVVEAETRIAERRRQQEEEAGSRLSEDQRAILSGGAIGPLAAILGRIDRLPLGASIGLLDTPFATLDGIEGPEAALDSIAAARELLKNARQSLMAADNPGKLKGLVVGHMRKSAGRLRSIAQSARQVPPEGSTAESLTPGSITLVDGYAARLQAQSGRLGTVRDKDELAAIGDDMLGIGTALASVAAPAGIKPQLIAIANACAGYSNAIAGIVGGREVALANAKSQIGGTIAILQPVAGVEPAPPTEPPTR